MKKTLTAILLLTALSASAQTTPEGFRASYERQKAAVGPAGLGVRTILDGWEAAFPDDTLMLEASFTYSLVKGRINTVAVKYQKKYLGKESLLSLKDSTGNDVHYFEVPAYDDELFASAQRSIEKAISLAPNNIGYRFDQITSLLDYEGESPDMAATALLDLIDLNYRRHPSWNLHGRPFSGDDFADAVKEYCYTLWNMCTPGAYEAFYIVSEKMHALLPRDPGFLDNMGAYYQVVKDNPKKAARYYKKALKLDPDDYAAKRNLQIIEKSKKK